MLTKSIAKKDIFLVAVQYVHAVFEQTKGVAPY